MKTNNEGIELIKNAEGLSLTAYPDPATKDDPIKKGDPWTIGYGHTGRDIKKGLSISKEQAIAYLVNDLHKFETGVDNLVKVELNENQFSALVSFAFNVGLGNLQSSTLLKLLNNSQFKEAAEQFSRWNKANGKVMDGLIKRRENEKKLFLTPV